jgi:hypothetical protein
MREVWTMSKKWFDPLFFQDVGVALLLLAVAGGVIGGWIALFKHLGVL